MTPPKQGATVSVWVPAPQLAVLDREASRQGVERTAYVRNVVKRHLQRKASTVRKPGP